jgi:hypothetical protein
MPQALSLEAKERSMTLGWNDGHFPFLAPPFSSRPVKKAGTIRVLFLSTLQPADLVIPLVPSARAKRAIDVLR